MRGGFRAALRRHGHAWVVRAGAERWGTEVWRRYPWLQDVIDDPAVKREKADNRSLRLLLLAALRSDSNCVDLGAHRGSVLAQIIEAAPVGRHVAYEPVPELARELVERFPTVDVRQAAAWYREGQSELHHVISAPEYSGLRPQSRVAAEPTNRLLVRTEPLDDALPSDYVPALIKIDVEGAELQVLRGARQLITRHRPLLVLEHTREAAETFGTTPEALHRLLGELGMTVYDLDGEGPYSVQALREAYDGGTVWNFLARPAS
jgi:FkbM family methyltransferase